MYKNLLCIGDINGPYRSPIIMTKLMDYNPNKDLNIIHVSKAYTISHAHKNILVRTFILFISNLYYWIELLLKLPFADAVYMMPMNHRYFLPLYILNIFFRKPILSDLYISIYTTSLDRGINENSVMERTIYSPRYLKLLDRLIIEKSKLVTHPTKSELVHISEMVGANLGTNYAVLPLAVERRKYANPIQSDIFRICWWGSWIPLHGIENILDAVKITVQNDYNIHLDLLGTASPEADNYRKLVEKLSISEYVTIYNDKNFTNGLLEEHLVSYCDLALGNFGSSEKSKNVFTNKIIDAMAMGIPVFTMNNSVLNEFFDIDNDVFVSSNDPDEMATEIIRIINNPSERERRAVNGHSCYLKDFTPEKYYDDFISLIHGLINKNQ